MKNLKQAYEDLTLRDLQAHVADFAEFGIQKAFVQWAKSGMAKSVPSRGLKYASVDDKGRPRVYSGRVYLPTPASATEPMALPLVIYSHGTEVKRDAVPYYNKGEEALLGAMGAQLFGLAVAMPDLPGMGADPSPEHHAYCHEFDLATCVLDFIRAVKGSRIFDGKKYKWDGNLYIMGYSEGGYVTMATLKALSTSPAAKDIQLNGAACMGGPFNIAASVRDMLKDPAIYTRPYIPAYLLTAWNDLYPHEFPIGSTINKELLKTGTGPADKGDALQWLKGNLGGDAITPMIQARLTGNSATRVPARAVMDEAWTKHNLDPDGTPAVKLLEQNSLGASPAGSPKGVSWAPKVPVLMAHDPKDECVPYELNTKLFYDAWTSRRINPAPTFVRLEARGKNPGHVGGAILSIPMAFAWFSSGMRMVPMGMDMDSILKSVHTAIPGGMPEMPGMPSMPSMPSMPAKPPF